MWAGLILENRSGDWKFGTVQTIWDIPDSVEVSGTNHTSLTSTFPDRKTKQLSDVAVTHHMSAFIPYLTAKAKGNWLKRKRTLNMDTFFWTFSIGAVITECQSCDILPLILPKSFFGSTLLWLCFPDFDNLKLPKKDYNRLVEMLPVSLPWGNKAISFILISKKRQFWQYLLCNAKYNVEMFWHLKQEVSKALGYLKMAALSYLAGQVQEALAHLWLTAKEIRSSDL